MKRFLLLLLITISTAFGTEHPPNIVFILADDLGITDIAAFTRHCTGAKADELFYESPNLDKLVAAGIAVPRTPRPALTSRDDGFNSHTHPETQHHHAEIPLRQ